MAAILVSLLLLAATQPALLPADAADFIGCYVDHFKAAERDLPHLLFLEEQMTVSWCEQLCSARGYSIFGLQFGQECWCGDEQYGKYGQATSSKQCEMPCGGDQLQMCGGDSVNSVYKVTDHEVSPRQDAIATYTPSQRPLIGLVMIVKDEAHTLPQTLMSIKPHIDVYFILDTGSTDGTQDVIRQSLAHIPGEVWEEPFVDYGTSRNRALEIAEMGGKLGKGYAPIFSLMLSADETLYNAVALHKFCTEHRDGDGVDEEAYPLVMDVGWRFDSLRLSRTDKSWRYMGKVHEYLSAPDKSWHPSQRVPDVFIKFKVTDPERRSQREYKIRDLLLQAVAEDPTDTRSSFYLARTYNVLRNHSAALEEFRRRVALGGWEEEVYESLYAIAWQMIELQYSWAEVQDGFLRTYQHSPERAEPLYAIANKYYEKKDMALTFMFALHASKLPYPQAAVLWVQKEVYTWQAHFLVAMSAMDPKINELETGARSALIANHHQPRNAVIMAQLGAYKSKLQAVANQQAGASGVGAEQIMQNLWSKIEQSAGYTDEGLPVQHATDDSPHDNPDHHSNIHTLELVDEHHTPNNRINTFMRKHAEKLQLSTAAVCLIIISLSVTLFCAINFVRRGKLKGSKSMREIWRSNDKIV